MADQVVQLPSDAANTGRKIDNSELTVGAATVERQRIVIADTTSATALATVTASNALKVDGSAVTQPVSGTVTSNQGTAGSSQWPVLNDVNPSVAGVTQTPLFATIAASSSGNNTIVAAVSAKRIRVLSVTLIATAAVNVKWISGATDISGVMNFAINGGYSANCPTGLLRNVNVNENLILNLSGAIAVGGHLSYITE